jgi:serine/threonine protein kinase
MAEQALKQIDEGGNQAMKPHDGSAVSLVPNLKNSIAPAVKSDKNIALSTTYQNNRKQILAVLQNLNNNFQPFGTPNLLHDRFKIDYGQALPQYSRTQAKAYAATDLQHADKICVCLVVEKYFPHRHGLIDALKGQHSSYLTELLDSGVVYLEELQEARMVLIYEQPKGASLAEMLKAKSFMNQPDVVKRLIAPVAAGIAKLQSLRMVHGEINPNNIFINGKNIELWDCIAQPCGYGQLDIYEPLERLLPPSGMRGEPTLASDIYALGILALDACGLLENKKQFNHTQLYPAFLQKGIYNVLVDEEQITTQPLFDLLRGTLVENPQERWGLEQLTNFIGGKRYNLVPVTFKETARPYNFANGEYVTLRSLAHAYATNWDSALKSIADNKIVKWADTLSQKNDMKEKVERMHQRAGRSPATGKAADDVIIKTISTLDPYGAIRFKPKNLNVTATAIPAALSAAFKEGDLTKQIAVREFIEAELTGFWRDLLDYNRSQLQWNPEQTRLLLRSSSIGFGMERILYELNPTLPCMSRSYAKYHSLSAKHMMLVLDHFAHNHAEDSKLYDKHLLAFLAARAGITKEVQIKDFRGYENLQNNHELQAIMLLASVQEKLKLDALPALCCWAALKIAEMIEEFHGLEVRQAISRDMLMVLPRGRLSYLLKILHNKDNINRDIEWHHKAVQMFMRGNSKINHYRNKEMIAKKAEKEGQRFALSISLLILLVVSYGMIIKYMF